MGTEMDYQQTEDTMAGGTDGTVEIAVSGASDDLIEVTGPCWEYDIDGAYTVQADRGEYDVGGATGNDRPAVLQLSDAERKPVAMIYAMYTRNGNWVFALGGVVQDGSDEPTLQDTITAVTRQSSECEYSTELVITAPAGTRFDVVDR